VFENPTATTTTPATVTTSTVMTAATMDNPVAGASSSREYDGVNGRSDSDICGIFNDYHSPDNGGDSRVREHTGTSAFSTMVKHGCRVLKSTLRIVGLRTVLLRDNACDWFDTLSDTQRSNWGDVRAAFMEQFQDSDLLRWKKASEMWNRHQAEDECVDAYITSMQKMAKAVNVQGDQLRYAIQRGLQPQLLAHVVQSQPTTVEDLIKAARVAEAAAKETTTGRVVAELAAPRRFVEGARGQPQTPP